MIRFAFRKKLLKDGNVPFKAVELANAHGRLLGVLRYLDKINLMIIYQKLKKTDRPLDPFY